MFEDEIDSPMGKQEKRMVKKLKKSMAEACCRTKEEGKERGLRHLEYAQTGFAFTWRVTRSAV